MEDIEAFAKAVKDVEMVAKLGLLADLAPVHNNKIPMALSSVAASADTKSMTEHANDQQVHHQHSIEEHCLAPKMATEKKADSLAWRASNPTALEKGVQAAAPSQMLVGTANEKSILENDNDQPVLHEHSAAEDGTASISATGEDTGSLACRSRLMITETKFPDAPWRKDKTPVK